MFILTQDMETLINSNHIVKISTKSVAPAIRATLDTGETIMLGGYLPEDTAQRDREFKNIFLNICADKGMFIKPYVNTEKPIAGEFVD